MCIYTGNVCNKEVFQVSFPQFAREAKYEKSEHSWSKKNVVLNTVLKKHTAHPVIQFSQREISIHTSLVLYILLYRV
jgi:hypothetical protein